MTAADLLGAWPIAMVIAAVALRLLADRSSDRPSRIVLETAAQVAIVAGAVGFALLFGRRLGL